MGDASIPRFAELVQITAGTEAGTAAFELNLAHEGIFDRQRQRFAEGVTQAGGVGIALVRPVQDDAQTVAIALQKRCLFVRFRSLRTRLPRRQPSAKLRTMLQAGIRQRLGEQPIRHACLLVVTQEPHQHHRRDGVAGDSGRQALRLFQASHRNIHQIRHRVQRLTIFNEGDHRTIRQRQIAWWLDIEINHHARRTGKRR